MANLNDILDAYTEEGLDYTNARARIHDASFWYENVSKHVLEC